MKYAIIKFKGDIGWARVLKKNKNGSVRIRLFSNWDETISSENVFDIVDAPDIDRRLAEIKKVAA